MKSAGPCGWTWQWVLVLLLLTIGTLALLEPETAEAARSMVTISAMVGVGWFVWRLMNYE